MGIICTGANCPRYKECGRYVENLSSKYRQEPWYIHTLGNLATCGSVVCLDTEPASVKMDCGPLGNYAMFEPIKELNYENK